MGRIQRNCSPWTVIFLLFFSVGFSTQKVHDQAPNDQLSQFMVYMRSTLPSIMESKFREVINEKLEDILKEKMSNIIKDQLPSMLENKFRDVVDERLQNFKEDLHGYIEEKLEDRLPNIIGAKISGHFEELVLKIENHTSKLISEPLRNINSSILYLKENAVEHNTLYKNTTECLQKIINNTDFLQDYTGDVQKFQTTTIKQLQTIMINSESLVENAEETGVIQENTTALLTAVIATLDTKASSSQLTSLQNVLDQMATRTDLTQVKGSMATKSDVTELQNAIAYQISLIQDEVELVAKKTDIALIQATLRNVPSKSDLRPIQNSVSTITSLATITKLRSIDSSVNKILGIVREHPEEFNSVDGEHFLIVTKTLPWADARRYCQNKGGDLAVPNDLNALESHLLSQGVSDHYWLGGSDLSSEGSWKWVDGRAISSSYDSFWPGGSQLSNSDQDCLVFWKRSLSDSQYLGDDGCNNRQYFICERW